MITSLDRNPNKGGHPRSAHVSGRVCVFFFLRKLFTTKRSTKIVTCYLRARRKHSSAIIFVPIAIRNYEQLLHSQDRSHQLIRHASDKNICQRHCDRKMPQSSHVDRKGWRGRTIEGYCRTSSSHLQYGYEYGHQNRVAQDFRVQTWSQTSGRRVRQVRHEIVPRGKTQSRPHS